MLYMVCQEKGSISAGGFSARIRRPPESTGYAEFNPVVRVRNIALLYAVITEEDLFYLAIEDSLPALTSLVILPGAAESTRLSIPLLAGAWSQ